MLVPTMTLQQIRKALVTDYERELKGKLKMLAISSKGKWMRNGRRDFAETVMYTTQSMNNWRITLEYKNGFLSTTPYLISYNDVGITASHFMTDWGPEKLLHFNTHFFKRYQERGKIDLEKPQDVVKHFFRNNKVMLPCYFPMDDGSLQLFCPLAGGIGLGRYHEEANILEFKTFVDNSLLREDQIKEVQEIFTNTINELMAEFRRRLKRD